MVRANFTACGQEYINDTSLVDQYGYFGPTHLIPANPNTQITYDGCVALCGKGDDYYDWPTASTTITTWILPVIGVLLQAPFESNAFWRTIKAIDRWVGSPMATMSYILWNIEVSGKCALFVDMAIPYEDPIPGPESDFADIRDSFYLLMNLNQYKLKPLISLTKEAEGLLRICLFSKDLPLLGSAKTLNQRRRRLAQTLRSNRKRGSVPVFISTLWFLVAVAISIESAFGQLGSNAQAHNLALGLLISWFPVLILSSIVDRNPVASDDIRLKINKLIDLVCTSLEDPESRARFIQSFSDMPEAERMGRWVNQIATYANLIKGDFFTGFAGQARGRFHFGAAHAILIDIEKAYMADHGRGWLSHDERSARARLVLGRIDHGFVWFDSRQAWQILWSVLLTFGTASGAFIISYFTPTVGLGCRAGGYLIFIVIALGLLLSEILVWALTSPIRKNRLTGIIQERMSSLDPKGEVYKNRRVDFPGLAASKATLTAVIRFAETVVVATVTSLVRILPLPKKRAKVDAVEVKLRKHFKSLLGLTGRQWAERVFFTPVEFGNTVWLCYMLAAQTFGAFNNCVCETSIWGPGGGYLDFADFDFSNNNEVAFFWLLGTIISCTIMTIGLTYVVIQWCLQAHLSTEDYEDAARGLRRVRRFRRFTFWLRWPASIVVMAIMSIARALGFRETGETKALVWTKSSKNRSTVAFHPAALHLPTMEPQNRPVKVLTGGELSIEEKSSQVPSLF